MKLRNVLIGCGIVLVVLCIGGVAVFLVVLKPAAEALVAPITTSNDFMTAVITKDYTKAYGMVLPAQQANFGGSPDGMQQMFSSKGLEPSDYKTAGINITSDAVVNGTGTFSGTTKYVAIRLQQDSGTWKILGLSVNDNPPTATPAS